MTEKEEGELRERSGADSLAEGGELGGAGQVAEDLHGGARGCNRGAESASASASRRWRESGVELGFGAHGARAPRRRSSSSSCRSAVCVSWDP
jgi:hypothetical protein